MLESSQQDAQARWETDFSKLSRDQLRKKMGEEYAKLGFKGRRVSLTDSVCCSFAKGRAFLSDSCIVQT